MHARGLRRPAACLTLLAVLATGLPGCASMAPRASEPVTTQVAKGVVYYPGVVLLVLLDLCVSSTNADRDDGAPWGADGHRRHRDDDACDDDDRPRPRRPRTRPHHADAPVTDPPEGVPPAGP